MIVMDLTRLLIRCHTGDSYTRLSGVDHQGWNSRLDQVLPDISSPEGCSWWYRVSSGTCFVGSSSVPQGSVLGLSFFSSNDLPDGVTHSTVRLFTDNCILYRHVTDKNDINRLEMDLDRIGKWEETWLMEFNVGKWMDPPIYILLGQVLCITDITK